ncbi:MAG TPA: SHOCT domain-containing protein [Mycobacterium sp.]|nr:SHOCT domain-containing protein [Mycobacterium sp.]
MNRRSAGPRRLIVVSVVSMVTAFVGFFVMLLLNTLVLDDFDAYGEVPVPGAGSVELPAGEVTISFHVLITGTSGVGLPVPPLRLGIEPPGGVQEPTLTERSGATTTVNNDARVQVWVMQVPEAGVYRISTDGEVQGYINPRLAFGHGSPYSWLLWLFGGMFLLGVGVLVAGLLWSARLNKRAQPIAAPDPAFTEPVSYLPTDQGIRLEQLKTIAALRDSGALTEGEFEAEKRRILGG